MSWRTILVVDDDPYNCDAIAEALRDDGYVVLTLCDPQRAVEVARRVPRPCVLVVDLMMPFVSGHDLVGLLRADPSTADLPVITCSAGLDEMPAGANAHLQKPFSIDELLAVVAHAFDQAAREARL